MKTKKNKISKVIDILLEHQGISLTMIYDYYKKYYPDEFLNKIDSSSFEAGIRRDINQWRGDLLTNNKDNPPIIILISEKYYFVNVELLEENIDKFNLSSKSLDILNKNYKI